MNLNDFEILVMRTDNGVQTRLVLVTVVAVNGVLPLFAPLPSAMPCASVPELEGGKMSLIRLNDGEVHMPYGTC